MSIKEDLEILEARVRVIENIVDISEMAQLERKWAKAAHDGLRTLIEGNQGKYYAIKEKHES